MDNTFKIQMSLDLASTKMVQELHLHNRDIEAQIERGIKLAIEDLLKDGNLVEAIRAQAKKEIMRTINTATMSWGIRNKITDMIQEKVSENIDAMAKKIADNLTSHLKVE